MSGAQEKLKVFPSQKGCADSLSVCHNGHRSGLASGSKVAGEITR